MQINEHNNKMDITITVQTKTAIQCNPNLLSFALAKPLQRLKRLIDKRRRAAVDVVAA
jgi:hypothetical protein